MNQKAGGGVPLGIEPGTPRTLIPCLFVQATPVTLHARQPFRIHRSMVDDVFRLSALSAFTTAVDPDPVVIMVIPIKVQVQRRSLSWTRASRSKLLKYFPVQSSHWPVCSLGNAFFE